MSGTDLSCLPSRLPLPPSLPPSPSSKPSLPSGSWYCPPPLCHAMSGQYAIYGTEKGYAATHLLVGVRYHAAPRLLRDVRY
eukprot:2950624-Rhodomonas_salina.3